jgi:hypothetical protein
MPEYELDPRDACTGVGVKGIYGTGGRRGGFR